MAITDLDELVETVQTLMGTSFEKVTEPGYETAASQAQSELGWTVPLEDTQKCYWLIERARRHTIYILMVESAYKFQYKQIHLEHRFKHYIQLIQQLDTAFYKAMELFPELFDGMEGTFSDFAFFIDPGFVYDTLGRDITYTE